MSRIPYSEPEADDSPPRTPTREIVESLGSARYDYEQAVKRTIGALSDEQLVAVERTLAGLTETNCWYATYHARDEIKRSIAERRYRESRAVGGQEQPNR